MERVCVGRLGVLLGAMLQAIPELEQLAKSSRTFVSLAGVFQVSLHALYGLLGLPSQRHKSGGLTIGMYCLIALEAGCLRCGCTQSWLLLKTRGGG